MGFFNLSGTSDKHQNDNHKTIIAFGKFIGSSFSSYLIVKVIRKALRNVCEDEQSDKKNNQYGESWAKKRLWNNVK